MNPAEMPFGECLPEHIIHHERGRARFYAIIARDDDNSAAIAPDDAGEVSLVILTAGGSATITGPERTRCLKKWLQHLRTGYQPKLNWQRFADEVSIPKRTLEALPDQGRAFPWSRAMKLVDYQATRFLATVESDELRQALILPADDRRRLSPGAYREILKVPKEYHPDAIKLLLHSGTDIGPFDAVAAKDILRRNLLEPKAAEAAWNEGKPQLAKDWKSSLGEWLHPRQRNDLLVRVAAWEDRDRVRGLRSPEDRVELKALPTAPKMPGGLRWIHLAVKHGHPVTIVPDPECKEGSRAVIDPTRLRLAEEAATRAH
ncbi:hypothetical protein ACFQY0_08870 [Haloferula chungangensis]|uniref:Uncharacterized protein n=1 Tax=Haloferula chungangensis TaxID=1048331 RepID=A0ABW2L6C3_9BACT